MGVYLSKPNLKKDTASGENAQLRFGYAAMQGWRMTMEDAHICTPSLTEETSLFAVFDGHGGDEVAKFCERMFGEHLQKNPAFREGRYKQALEETFLKMDTLLQNSSANGIVNPETGKEYDPSSPAGCTANVVLVTRSEIYVANAGDSRAYLFTKDNRTVALSKDHKPDDDAERERISKAGGYVSNGRVCDNLNLSRAIGDLTYKKTTTLPPKDQMITAFPDVVVTKLDGKAKFLLMGCDGIWETLTAEEICRLADISLNKPGKAPLVDTAKELLDRLIAKDTVDGTGCDNMSLIIVQFKD